MGGRGASSGMGRGGISGITVRRDGESTDYYFTTRDGMNYYKRGIGGEWNPTPQNMSRGEFRSRMEANGATVQNISDSKRRSEEQRYRKEREEAERDLDRLWLRGAGRPRKGWRGH